MLAALLTSWLVICFVCSDTGTVNDSSRNGTIMSELAGWQWHGDRQCCNGDMNSKCSAAQCTTAVAVQQSVSRLMDKLLIDSHYLRVCCSRTLCLHRNATNSFITLLASPFITISQHRTHSAHYHHLPPLFVHFVFRLRVSSAMCPL